MGLSLGTVSTYWARCRTKLGVGTRAACVASLLGYNSPRQESLEPQFEARWNAVMQVTTEAVAIVSPTGRVSQASRAFLEVLDSSLADLRRPGSRLADRPSRLEDLPSVIGSDAPALREPHLLARPDGSTEIVYVSSFPVKPVEHDEPTEALLRIDLN